MAPSEPVTPAPRASGPGQAGGAISPSRIISVFPGPSTTGDTPKLPLQPHLGRVLRLQVEEGEEALMALACRVLDDVRAGREPSPTDLAWLDNRIESVFAALARHTRQKRDKYAVTRSAASAALHGYRTTIHALQEQVEKLTFLDQARTCRQRALHAEHARVIRELGELRVAHELLQASLREEQLEHREARVEASAKKRDLELRLEATLRDLAEARARQGKDGRHLAQTKVLAKAEQAETRRVSQHLRHWQWMCGAGWTIAAGITALWIATG